MSWCGEGVRKACSIGCALAALVISALLCVLYLSLGTAKGPDLLVNNASIAGNTVSLEVIAYNPNAHVFIQYGDVLVGVYDSAGAQLLGYEVLGGPFTQAPKGSLGLKAAPAVAHPLGSTAALVVKMTTVVRYAKWWDQSNPFNLWAACSPVRIDLNSSQGATTPRSSCSVRLHN